MSGFPAALTEEEKHLKNMYDWLRKIKSAIKAEEAAKAEAAGAGKVEEKRRSASRSISEQESATEAAKRLAKSGALTVQKQSEKQSFKRSSHLDKRLKESGDAGTGPKFNAYSESMLGDYAAPSFEESARPSRSEPRALYSSFVSGGVSGGAPGERAAGGGGGKADGGWGGDSGAVESGCSVFVRGFDLMEDPLRKAFTGFGPIRSLTIDDRRRSANIDFAEPSQASAAIDEMNGNNVNGVTLRVSVARPSNPWAAPPKAKAPRMDATRELVSYDDPF